MWAEGGGAAERHEEEGRRERKKKNVSLLEVKLVQGLVPLAMNGKTRWTKFIGTGR